MSSDVFFRMENINKFYRMGDEDMQVLRDINLEIREGEYLSVLGPSGSGKSTLMNIRLPGYGNFRKIYPAGSCNRGDD